MSDRSFFDPGFSHTRNTTEAASRQSRSKALFEDIEHWKREGFAFEARFPGEYDLWINRQTLQKLRRYVDGREWLSDLTTGEYALIQDTPNV